MPRRPLSTDDLWALPRVGSPVPSPDGEYLLVPVTTYSMETNEGTTRLWLVPSVAEKAGAGGAKDPARVLTTSDASTGRPAMSPDGRQVAFVRKPLLRAGGKGAPDHADVTQLHIMPTTGGEPTRVTDLPLGAAEPRWFPDGRRVAFVALVYRDALTIEQAAERKKAIAEDPVTAHVTEDRVFRMWDKWVTDGRVHHIFVLDVETGELMDVTPTSTCWISVMEIDEPFFISPDGKEIAFTACASRPPHSPILWSTFTVRVPARVRPRGRVGAPKRLTPASFARGERPVYSPDGKYIVYGMQREIDFYADRVRLVAFDRKKRTHTVLTEAWDRSAERWSFGDDGKTLYFLAETHARTAIYSLDLTAAVRDPEGTRPVERLRGGTFGAPEVVGDRIYMTRSSLGAPPEVHSCRTTGRTLRRVTAFTEPVMRQVERSEIDEFIFDGHGNDPVQMFLVYPPGVKKPAEGRKPAKKRPLVHLVHGGPHGVFGDTWHWRWNAQRVAADGYVTALVNFHGSTSWGHRFTSSILGRWGDQPYEDVMRATDELIERGIADPRRMAVAGGSYGGYLVSWIAAKTDRFSCIVNHAGVCDFQPQFASDFTQGRPRSMGGELWDHIEGLDRYNPMRHASGFRTPMLVLHGERDYRVPYVQGLEIYAVYKAMGLPARLVVYPDEGHWILKPRNSAHWYGEVLAWLARWVKKRSR